MRRLVPLILILAAAPRAQQSLLDLYNHAGVHQLGASVAGLGDVNGDGYADFVVGAPETSIDLQKLGGAAFLISGKTGDAFQQFYGKASGDRFGASVAAVGDLDGDGRSDFAIGAPRKAETQGYVQIRSSADGHLIHEFHQPAGAYAYFGFSVAGAGDTDADGWPDILVGAPFPAGPGSVDVYSGQTGTLLLHLVETPTPPFQSSEYGYSVSGVGDVDGDGHADFIVGQPGIVGSGEAGKALVHSGADGHVLEVFVGPMYHSEMGNSVAGCGDTDGDGAGDILVGAWVESASYEESGAAHLYSGRDGVQLHLFPGEGYYDDFGQSVAAAGDVDADGYADVVMSAPYSDVLTPYVSGNVYVYSGVDFALLAKLKGGDTSETSWHPPIKVAGVGDINRNGHADIAIGLPEQTPTFFLASEVHVYEFGCGQIEDYGAGCAGALGFAPVLVVTGCAAPAGTLALSLRDVPPAVQVLLLVGLGPADLPLPGGCSLLVTPIVAQLPLAAPGTPLQAKLPLQTLGVSFTLQAFVQPSGTTAGMAASQGVHVRID